VVASARSDAGDEISIVIGRAMVVSLPKRSQGREVEERELRIGDKAAGGGCAGGEAAGAEVQGRRAGGRLSAMKCELKEDRQGIERLREREKMLAAWWFAFGKEQRSGIEFYSRKAAMVGFRGWVQVPSAKA
ncbi:hypothetical protein TARUN_4034, partial [Trichoderma arundinaceum]